jgi:C1A family cysteine protease
MSPIRPTRRSLLATSILAAALLATTLAPLSPAQATPTPADALHAVVTTPAVSGVAGALAAEPGPAAESTATVGNPVSTPADLAGQGETGPTGLAESAIDLQPILEANYAPYVAAQEPLPSSYDLRVAHPTWVTPVKNEGTGGCWGFASVASAESSIARNGAVTAATDLSEALLFAAVKGSDQILGQPGWEDSQGGAVEYAATVWSLWRGLRTEEAYSLARRDDSFTAEDLASSDFHLQNWLYLPAPRNSQGEYIQANVDAIKTVVHELGAATIMYSTGAYNSFNSSKAAYYSYRPEELGWTDHVVAVVGWDDNYPKENFNVTPPADGAFLIKNSWGTPWGDNGYFWMSYYSYAITPGSYFDVKAAGDAPGGDGWEHNYGWDVGGYLGRKEPGQATSSVFTSGEGLQDLGAVQFVIPGPQMSYEIQVLVGGTSGAQSGVAQPITATGGTVLTGTETFAGWHTVDLPRAVRLEPGTRFTVVVKFTAASGGGAGVVPIDRSAPNSGATVLGRSYILVNGVWSDLAARDTSEYRHRANIKAFTSDVVATTQVAVGHVFVSGMPLVGGTLTAVRPTTVPANATVSYTWLRDGSPITGATSASYTVTAADGGHLLRVRAQAAASGKTAGTAVSEVLNVAATSSGAIMGNLVDQAGNGLVGWSILWYNYDSACSERGMYTATLAKGSVQTAANGAYAFGQGVTGCYLMRVVSPEGVYWDPWFADGQFYSAGVTPPATGVLLRVMTDTAAIKQVRFDVNFPLPGTTITAAAYGVEPANASVTYEWQRSGVVMPDVTGPSYTVLPSEIGKHIGVTVTVTSPVDGSTASAWVETQVSAGQITIDSVAMNGTPKVGATLTATLGMVTPTWAKVTYEWFTGVDRVSADSSDSTYVVKPEDAGKALWVRARAAATGYTTGFAQTTPVTVANLGPVTIGAVTITGTAAPGNQLQATVAGLDPTDATLAYQWYRGTAAIAGATSATYTLTAADAGRDIVLKVTASKTGLTSVTKYSNHVQVFGVTKVEITGNPAPGSTLQLGVSFQPSTATVTYQWYRGTAAISGAKAATYTLTAADAGQDISAKVVVTQAGLGSITKYSNHILVLGASKAVLSGSPYVGSVLTLELVTAPADATVAVVWFRGTSTIPGVTGTTYTLTGADAGQDISAKVTVSKTGVGSQVKYSNHVVVSTAQPTLEVTPGEWAAPWAGGSVAVRVTASVGAWTVVDGYGLPDWLQVSHQAGASGDRVVLQAARNEGAARTAVVTLAASSLTTTVTVTQAAAPDASLTLSQTAWAAPAGVGSLMVRVTANRQVWQVATDQSWLKVSTAGERSGDYLVVGVDSNPGTSSRVGQVTVTAGGVTRVLTVTQGAGPALVSGTWQGYYESAPDAMTDPTLVWAKPAGFGAVTVYDKSAWLTSVATDQGVAATWTANTGMSPRWATVTVMSGSTVVGTVVVCQQAMGRLVIGSYSWAVGATGGSVSRVVTFSQWMGEAAASPWTVDTDAEWLHVPPMPGGSETTAVVVADANTTGATRVGHVTFYATGALEPQTVTVTQAG